MTLRQAVFNLEESMIRQVANAGMGRSDVLKFWFGESDEVTPAFIRDAAAASLMPRREWTRSRGDSNISPLATARKAPSIYSCFTPLSR